MSGKSGAAHKELRMKFKDFQLLCKDRYARENTQNEDETACFFRTCLIRRYQQVLRSTAREWTKQSSESPWTLHPMLLERTKTH